MKSINPKFANNIIKALEAGVTPTLGIGNLLVGRNKEVEEVIKILTDIKEGGSDIRFWVGDFGSGKSFMLATISNLALEKDFVCSTIDLAVQRRFYATDRKAVALYREIVDNIKTKSKRDSSALADIIEAYLQEVFQKVSFKTNKPLEAIINGEDKALVEEIIISDISNFTNKSLSYEFSKALIFYYRAIINQNTLDKLLALRWFRADIPTKTESKRDLSINQIINDDNYFDAIKLLGEFFLKAGYSGFVINFDEAVNLYKIPQSVTRERNYERILNIYNECKSNKARGIFINFGATFKTIYDENRGLSSYKALKSRLSLDSPSNLDIINTNKTVLELKVLTDEQIYTLLENLLNIYNTNYKTNINLIKDDILLYMNYQLNRPGAKEFLTPRAVIKDYLEILDIKRQNDNFTINEILNSKFTDFNKAVSKDPLNLDDEIEIIWLNTMIC